MVSGPGLENGAVIPHDSLLHDQVSHLTHRHRVMAMLLQVVTGQSQNEVMQSVALSVSTTATSAYIHIHIHIYIERDGYKARCILGWG